MWLVDERELVEGKVPRDLSASLPVMAQKEKEEKDEKPREPESPRSRFANHPLLAQLRAQLAVETEHASSQASDNSDAPTVPTTPTSPRLMAADSFPASVFHKPNVGSEGEGEGDVEVMEFATGHVDGAASLASSSSSASASSSSSAVSASSVAASSSSAASSSYFKDSGDYFNEDEVAAFEAGFDESEYRKRLEEEEVQRILQSQQSPEAIARAKRIDDVSKLLGAKLMAGWTMLGSTCPEENCGCVLMRDRDQVIHCVSCKKTLTQQPDGSYQLDFNPSASSSSSSSSSSSASAASSSSSSSSIAPVSTPVPSRTVSSFSSSSLPDSFAPSSSSSSASSSSSSTKASDDEVSQRMGELLLSGWAMLAQDCPQCEGVPLMRNRQGQMKCVSCNATVVTEEEYDPSVHGVAANRPTSGVTSSSSTSSSASSSVTSSAPASSSSASSLPSSSSSSSSYSHKRSAVRRSKYHNVGSDSESEEEEEESLSDLERKEQEAMARIAKKVRLGSAPTRPTQSVAPAHISAPSSSSIDAVLSSATQAVVSRIDWCQQELSSPVPSSACPTSKSQFLNAQIQTAAFLTELAKALAALKQTQ